MDADKTALEMIWSRLDRMEQKLDTLLEFKWKIVGGTVLASLILTVLFKVLELGLK